MLLVLFDGECAFCSRNVQLIISLNKAKNIFFAPLQGATAMKYSEMFQVRFSEFNSFVFIENEQYYTRGNAVVQVSKYLKGFRHIQFLLKIIPISWLNGIYDMIGNHRHQLVANEYCKVYDAETKKRFLP